MLDFIIVGGGSAGCVLASRLTEDPRVSVLLIEAGMDVSEELTPKEILASYPGKAFFNTRLTWPGLTAQLGGTLDDGRGKVRMRYEQARVLGGGSSINGLLANRGAPFDYDEWERLGAKGWNWNTVLPYFRKLERDIDLVDSRHGQHGPITIRRFPREDWTGFTASVVRALEKRGFQMLPDQSGEWQEGYFAASCSVNESEERESCATRYLTQTVRRRFNLRIATDTLVRRVIFDGTRATGVEIATQSAPQILTARQIIVSCGSVFSPVMLMRSGVGGAKELAKVGAPIVVERSAVGANLQEHPTVGISCYLTPSGRLNRLNRHHTQVHLRFSSHVEGCGIGDMSMAIIARSAWHALGRRIGSLLFWANKSYSKGKITLRSMDPMQPPDVDFRLLSDPRDRERLRTAFRFVAELAASSEMDGCRTKAFPASYSDRVRKVSRPGLLNGVRMAGFGLALDALPHLQDRMIDSFITSGVRLVDLLGDPAALDSYIDRTVTGAWHAVGTCRMGDADDPQSVTDSFGSVHGVSGLSVCDASIMPTIPRANTNIPTIMLAERMADLVKGKLQ